MSSRYSPFSSPTWTSDFYGDNNTTSTTQTSYGTNSAAQSSYNLSQTQHFEFAGGSNSYALPDLELPEPPSPSTPYTASDQDLEAVSGQYTLQDLNTWSRDPTDEPWSTEFARATSTLAPSADQRFQRRASYSNVGPTSFDRQFVEATAALAPNNGPATYQRPYQFQGNNPPRGLPHTNGNHGMANTTRPTQLSWDYRHQLDPRHLQVPTSQRAPRQTGSEYSFETLSSPSTAGYRTTKQKRQRIAIEDGSELDKRVTCPKCGVTLKDRVGLKRHLQTKKHNPDYEVTLKHRCSACPKKYKDKKDLMRHFDSSHSDSRWACALCPEPLLLGRKDNAQRHVRLFHEHIAADDIANWIYPTRDGDSGTSTTV